MRAHTGSEDACQERLARIAIRDGDVSWLHSAMWRVNVLFTSKRHKVKLALPTAPAVSPSD
jgi:hypothetical protein